ncbi:diguanylate cyclase domain-containing protein [Paenibacillus sp.]|uniref:diguanylate cyclase domain-containing protein n=1 Tax=Paenibacillus sp. TaxID=58172 RepID=UPI002D3036CA|nr:diguanylate cyclase [Paenibacillus sp.]HZG84346.1 diguanylate cyclase [Paenibacillus sp.]
MKKHGDIEELYQHETDVLTRSRIDPRRPDLTGDELAARYEELLAEYEKLYKLTKKISAISDAQGVMLKRRENDIKSLLDHAKQGFLTFGKSLRVNRQFSQECIRIFGRSPAGVDVTELLLGDRDNERKALRKRLAAAFAPRAAAAKLEKTIASLPANADIGDKSVVLEFQPIKDETTNERLLLLVVTDVSERKASEERIRYLSSRDTLTSLYNRSVLEPMMEQPLAPEQLPASLMVVDLNGLKLANDVFGHRAGDRLLVRSAELLRATFGGDAVIGRWGGDEFVALLPRTSAAACAELASRLKAACDAAEAEPVRLSMAIGGATLERAGESWSGAFAVAEKQMYKNKLLESKRVRIDMMRSVTDALLAKRVQRKDHLDRLHDLVVRFAAELGFVHGSPDMDLLQSLVRLHDVGYLALPADVLLKEGPLNEEEWEIVKSHSEIGYRMASSIGEWALAEAILGLHERWDGGGYPYGLAEEQIPYFSRLVAIADAFDVMTSEQAYKGKRSTEEALNEILAEAGRQFDPRLAAAWAAWIRRAGAV